MILTVEIPENAKNVKVSVLCDGKQCHSDNSRYRPGYWNGLHGGKYYGQYFDMEDIDRIREMTEVISILKEYGIRYELSKFKRQYRITISRKDYFNMDEVLRNRIFHINCMAITGEY